MTLGELFECTIPVPFSGCWVWTKSLNSNGYGMLSQGRGKPQLRAHRLAYEQAHGPIPDGLELDHLCRVRACINPEHLEAVTHQENIRRGGTPATARRLMQDILARRALRTHCKRGHAWVEANIYIDPRGRRSCRLCTQHVYRDAFEQRRCDYCGKEFIVNRHKDQRFCTHRCANFNRYRR